MASDKTSLKILKCMEKYPILYDPKYDKLKVRQSYWNKVAEELDENVDTVKKKWKNLKDGYVKYLKNERDNIASGFRLSKEIEFVKPYLKSISPNALNETDRKMLQDLPFVNLWNEFQKVPDDMKNPTLSKMMKIVEVAVHLKPADGEFEDESAGEDSDSSDSGFKIKVSSLCNGLTKFV